MVTKKKTAKKKTAKKANTIHAKTDRPQRAKTRAKGRPQRRRAIGEFRDILTVDGMDPEFAYRWVLGRGEASKRIHDAHRAGWEMVDATAENELAIGDHAVGKTTSGGSLYRISANRSDPEEFLYLMRMPQDWADELHKQKMDDINEQEKSMFAQGGDGDNESGTYGSVKPENQFRVRET